jgi:HlyD family secretion protein
VRKGDLLGLLDRHEKARLDHARVSALFARGGASRREVEDAALTLEDQRLVSPVDGVVLVKVRQPGEVVSAGAPVVDVGDSADVYVRIFVPEGQINRVRDGQKARVFLDGLDAALEGGVAVVAPRAEFTPRNVQTKEERILQSFAVKVALRAPPASLRPGVSADVELEP